MYHVQCTAIVENFCGGCHNVGKRCAYLVATHCKVVKLLHFAAPDPAIGRITHHRVYGISHVFCGVFEVVTHDADGVFKVVELHVARGNVGKLLLNFHCNHLFWVFFVRNQNGNNAAARAKLNACFARHVAAKVCQQHRVGGKAIFVSALNKTKPVAAKVLDDFVMFKKYFHAYIVQHF